MVVAVAVFGAAACSDDSSGDEPSQANSDDEASAADPTTSTTQPPATDELALAIVEDLVAEAGEVTDRLFQNPSVVGDPGNRDVERLREIYTDDSPDLEGVITRLEELAEEGHRVRAGRSGVLSKEVIYGLAAAGEDTIEFGVCAIFDEETVDVDGNVVEPSAMAVLGTGEAHRVDGVWRFHGVQAGPDGVSELEPGDVPSQFRFCEEVYGSGDQEGPA